MLNRGINSTKFKKLFEKYIDVCVYIHILSSINKNPDWIDFGLTQNCACLYIITQIECHLYGFEDFTAITYNKTLISHLH